MRPVVLILVLVGLVLLGRDWQTEATRQEQPAVRRADPSTAVTHLLLGQPLGRVLGAPPLSSEEAHRAEQLSGESPFLPSPEPAAEPGAGSSPGPAPDSAAEDAPPSQSPPGSTSERRLHRVGQGDVLGTICERYYGTQRGDLPARLAAWNGLASPDHVALGQELLIPDLAELLEGRRNED